MVEEGKAYVCPELCILKHFQKMVFSTPDCGVFDHPRELEVKLLNGKVD